MSESSRSRVAGFLEGVDEKLDKLATVFVVVFTITAFSWAVIAKVLHLL